MRLVRLIAPGLLGLFLAAGVRLGADRAEDWVAAQVDAPVAAASHPFAAER